MVALASDAEFADLHRRGGPTFSYREEELLANRVRAKRQHFLAIRPKEVMRWANELLREDPERRPAARASPQDGIRVSRGETDSRWWARKLSCFSVENFRVTL